MNLNPCNTSTYITIDDSVHHDEVFSSMISLYRSKVLFDFEIQMDFNILYVHKLILASNSDFFKNMFLLCHQGERCNRIDLSNLTTVEVMSKIVDYFYTGTIVVNEEDIDQIYFISSYFMLQSLEKQCIIIIANRISYRNCIKMYKMSKICGCLYLMEKCIDCLNHQYLKVVKTPQFYKLSINEVCSLLSSNYINVSSEDDVLESCIEWVNHDPSSRSRDLPKLLKCVRFHYISRNKLDVYRNDICSLLRRGSEDGSTKNQDIVEVFSASTIDDIFNRGLVYYHTRGIDLSRSPRNVLDKRRTLLMVGGYDGSNCLNLVSALISVGLSDWIFLTSMIMSRNDHGVAAHNYKVYAVGGFSESYGPLRCVEMYESNQNKWIQISSMNTCRKSLSVAFLRSHLYATGGVDTSYSTLSSAEKYVEEENRWHPISSMNVPRSSHCLVSDGRYLYALGGVELKSAERYCPYLNIWENIEDMPSIRCGASAIYKKGKIYVLCGRDDEHYHTSMEIYHIQSKTWQSINDVVQIPRSKAGIAVYNNKIYICGGKCTSWTYTGSVESFELDTYKSQQELVLPLASVGSQCCCLELPIFYLEP